MNNNKPNILVFADFPNWAYHHIQQFIKDNLSDEFNIYTDFMVYNYKRRIRNPWKLLANMSGKIRYQNVRKDKKYNIVVYLGFYMPDHIRINWTTERIIKGIYTEGFPPLQTNKENVNSLEDFVRLYLHDTDALVCGSLQIKEFYSKGFGNVHYASGATDANHFRKKKEIVRNDSNIFRIGWTGNPERNFKGFYSHVVPAVEKAREKYPGIKLLTRFSGPLKTLPGFYEDIDLVVIASDADAGPSMFAEASYMNTPSISTRVGIPNEIIEDGVNGFFVERDIDEIAARIIQLYEERELLFKMSLRIRDDFLSKRNRDIMIKRWRTMFNEVLGRSQEH